jgi:methylated-DNA-[protein]-cysteine S-methyltransferase
MLAIPHGHTATYGDLARTIGSGPRAVARGCGANPIPIIVPCHRVVAAAGLGGYSAGAGVTTKQLLLTHEASGDLECLGN